MSITHSYPVTGMTCGHCVNAVTEELKHLEGVAAVDVALEPSGVSTVSVTSDAPLSDAQVVEALDEAGDYHLVLD